MSRVADASPVAANVLAALCISFANKELFGDVPWLTSSMLAVLHSFSNALFFIAVWMVGLHRAPKLVPLLPFAAAALTTLLSVVFWNENMRQNSLGLYQMSKLAAVAFTAVVEWVFLGARYGVRDLVDVVLLIVGGGLATVKEIQLEGTALSLSVAAASIVLGSVSVMLQGSLMRQYRVDAYDLNFYTQPLALVSLVAGHALLRQAGVERVAEVPADWYTDIFTANGRTAPVPANLMLSLACAATLVFTSARIAGAYPAIVYQIVGQLKSLATVCIGMVAFGEDASVQKIVGVALACGGVWDFQSRPRKIVPVASEKELSDGR